MMNILVVSNDTRPMIGGIATTLDAWLYGLSLEKHNVFICSFLKKEYIEQTKYLIPRNYHEIFFEEIVRKPSVLDKVVLLRKIRTFLHTIEQSRRVSEIIDNTIKSTLPDIIIIAFVNYFTYPIIKALAKYRIPKVAICYGSEMHPSRVSTSQKATIVNTVDNYIAISGYTKNLLVKHWNIQSDKVDILHPAFFPYEKPFLKSTISQNNSVKLLTVCRLVERKGVQLVLLAIHQIISLDLTMKRIEYVILGSGNYYERLVMLVDKLGLNEFVKFVGSVNEEEKYKYISECDIFLMTPYETDVHEVEGFGLVYLEAGTLGKPVIASDSGGVSDAVLDNFTGVLIPPKSVEFIVREILRMISNNDQAEIFGQNGIHWASKHFPAAIGPQMGALLERYQKNFNL